MNVIKTLDDTSQTYNLGFISLSPSLYTDVYHLLRWILTCLLELTIASIAEYLHTEAKLLVVKKYIVTPYDKS